MDGCIFCSIIEGEIPSKKAYEDDHILAIYDVAPQAPVHLLILPKEHIESANAIDQSNASIMSEIFCAIPKICADLGITDGYRIVTNVGNDGRQSVNHIHFHVLAKKLLSETLG